MIAVVQSRGSLIYRRLTRCGQRIAALPTLEIQLGCGGEIAAGPGSGSHRSGDKNPIGRCVKAGNGRDVGGAGSVPGEHGEGRDEGQTGTGVDVEKENHPGLFP